MSVSRRDFITTAAGATAFGALKATAGAAARPEPKFIWSYLAHFGVNSWKDIPLETQDPSMPEKWLTRCCADHVRFDEPSWRRLTDALAKAGCNQIIIDLAEIVVYPSHPELAVKGSWSVDRLRAEIARLRGMGFEVIPKMNFSACHDTWLKDYHRMVSTKKYYQVCEDLIKDVAEIFDRPRFFHLGYDEETANHQRQHLFAVCRQGDLWWHDFLWFADVTEKTGCRPWIWSDYIWKHKDEFLKRMPKSVLQSNWYYGKNFDASSMGERSAYVEAYEWLDKAGFDQVPTGSNFSCDENFAGTVKFCDAKCRPELIKGYMMAPWTRTFAIHEEKSMQAIAQVSDGIKARGGAAGGGSAAPLANPEQQQHQHDDRHDAHSGAAVRRLGVRRPDRRGWPVRNRDRRRGRRIAPYAQRPPCRRDLRRKPQIPRRGAFGRGAFLRNPGLAADLHGDRHRVFTGINHPSPLRKKLTNRSRS